MGLGQQQMQVNMELQITGMDVYYNPDSRRQLWMYNDFALCFDPSCVISSAAVSSSEPKSMVV